MRGWDVGLVVAIALSACGDNLTLPPDAAPIPDAPCTYTLTAMPPQVSLGSVIVGSPSAHAQITITNSGTCTSGPLVLTLTGRNPAEFFVTNATCVGLDLRPAQTCSLEVFMQGSSGGGKQCELDIVGPHAMVAVPIDGSAVNGFR